MKENTENLNTKEEKKKNRLSLLILIFGMTSLVLIVATYAWFIGTSSVKTKQFYVHVKTTESMKLSLDALNWSEELEITQDNVTTNLVETYANHKNMWYEEITNENGEYKIEGGLYPVSSVGKIRTESSTLELYDKSSLTSLQGGYKLRADKIKNYDADNTPKEKETYIAFDLFIQNSTGGDSYEPTFNTYDDEGVYLLRDSYVKVSAAGSNEQEAAINSNTFAGIENSIRVAFMQIGRVYNNSSDDITINQATAAKAQAVTCTDGFDDDDPTEQISTGLCNLPNTAEEDESVWVSENHGLKRTWNIWEPNDTSHTEESITHFDRICKKRYVVDETHTTEYETGEDYCEPTSGNEDGRLEDGYAVSTYAINSQIVASDNVNIYDGLNNYTNVSTKLTNFDYFTDTDKNASPESREELFFLAPNSITKVRVYIYLEGQDVDNYDITTMSRSIELQFGFTKDKYDIGGIS